VKLNKTLTNSLQEFTDTFHTTRIYQTTFTVQKIQLLERCLKYYWRWKTRNPDGTTNPRNRNCH